MRRVMRRFSSFDRSHEDASSRQVGRTQTAAARKTRRSSSVAASVDSAAYGPTSTARFDMATMADAPDRDLGSWTGDPSGSTDDADSANADYMTTRLPGRCLNYHAFFQEFFDPAAPPLSSRARSRRASQVATTSSAILEDSRQSSPTRNVAFVTMAAGTTTTTTTPAAPARTYRRMSAASVVTPVAEDELSEGFSAGAVPSAFTKAPDPCQFFHRWSSDDGARACRQWCDRCPVKVGSKVGLPAVVRLLHAVTYLDALKIDELVNLFVPTVVPTMSCSQLYVMMAFILANDESRLCQFLFYHATWLFMHLKEANRQFVIERAFPLVRFADIPEENIIWALWRLHLEFYSATTFQQFQQVLFLIFDEWDRARSDDAMLATDDVVELDPSGCTCGV
ncbi:unnamed protein product (mitochondrion) [Plasmodiophora brassicae]|uniref:Uncharacterized protein n=1 Tax=Plasmodiophora brassicae TaxID=37360 RepID=A0A0G4IT58_PLABS|nr:hypothetical protein PBRA_006564 [Plasmodiophora brassicae]SPQ94534.1 unnamed protein product [Plasmodiophora brassicae]